MNQYFVYILANYTNDVLYIGVTNDLSRRVCEHKSKLIKGFTSKYNVNKLVYFDTFSSVKDAIENEKRLKGWVRSKKIALVAEKNPNWKDLAEQ
jgi:putative endonuclease